MPEGEAPKGSVPRPAIVEIHGGSIDVEIVAGGGTVPLKRMELFMMAFLPPRNECEGVGLRGAPYTPAPQLYLQAMASSAKPELQQFALKRQIVDLLHDDLHRIDP